VSKKKRAHNDVSLAVRAINRAALVNVPVVGPIITELMGVYGDEFKQRQLDALAEELNAVMKLVEGKVDRQFLEGDDFAALVMRVMRDSLQTTDRKKVRYLAAVLGGSATAERIETLEVEAILNAMAQLTSADMVLARAFVAQMGRVNVLEGEAVPEVVPNAHFHAARLESAGFIERSGNALRGRTAPYVPTSVLNQLMDMIGPLLADEP
jgi:hypothetical protein